MNGKTNSNERAATPGGTGAAKGKTNAQNVSQCLCGGQPATVRRIDLFAAVAMLGILANRPDAFDLCDEGGDLALAASHAARAMEMAALAMGGGR
jgi:hypothetical protein